MRENVTCEGVLFTIRVIPTTLERLPLFLGASRYCTAGLSCASCTKTLAAVMCDAQDACSVNCERALFRPSGQTACLLAELHKDSDSLKNSAKMECGCRGWKKV